jgi:hypothetical protein
MSDCLDTYKNFLWNILSFIGSLTLELSEDMIPLTPDEINNFILNLKIKYSVNYEQADRNLNKSEQKMKA